MITVAPEEFETFLPNHGPV